MAKRVIVTIGREFGSGGREIGKALADSLGVEFYDKELLEVAAKESGISRDLFESNDEKPVSSLLYSMSVNPYSMGNLMGVDHVPINQKLFLAQFDAIRKIVRERDCVIVGRCADYALRDEPDCLNVFIHAPLQYRVERVKRLYEMSGGEAKDMISKIDKKRAAYYNSYSDKKWGRSAATTSRSTAACCPPGTRWS
ncbi:MAG: AAA family ATPase [Anaerotruncus massiliensis (ex Togo et al. 2019)]